LSLSTSREKRREGGRESILAVTVLGDTEDVLAVVRTAALLGNSFKASTSIDLLGESAIHIESGENGSPASLEKLMQLVDRKLSEQGTSQVSAFTVEASITAASFLTIGSISVNVRKVPDSAPKRPAISR
jgi:hypothetical protein